MSMNVLMAFIAADRCVITHMDRTNVSVLMDMNSTVMGTHVRVRAAFKFE